MSLTPDQALADFRPGLPFAVALSGGADSTALLIACAQRWPGQVRAIHVHHGLQAAADGFEKFCVALCERLGVPLALRRVDARTQAGQSPEDAARQARYAALVAAVQDTWGDAVRDVALAQHADDQVETLLIALSRGGGLAGLAGMPAQAQRWGLRWHRPWLSVAAADLRQWLHARGETWVEDPTNADQQFTRNRVRAQVLPALEAALPGFRDTFARSMRHAAQAQTMLEELAEQDLAEVGVPPAIAALQTLPGARQALVLRQWLRREHATTPSEAQLRELQAQLADCSTRGHRLDLRVGAGRVLREGAHLRWLPA
jgi:tRNA(Ile)-lysidine synthase